MGREIRRVPRGWQHPRDERGHFKPLYDEDYQSACQKWWADAMAHHNAEAFCPGSEERPHSMNEWWWDWNGPPPSEDSYRPAFTEPADHYQIYETVTEGTPCSPVFASLDEMANWMCQPIDRASEYNRNRADWQSMQGRTRKQAEAFIQAGTTFSFMVIPGRGIVDGVAALSETSR